jgi:hypothetical protein
MAYKVIIDMTAVLPKIKKLDVKLGFFAEKSVILELDADNPDDACYLAYREFCEHIVEQDNNSETKSLLRDLKNEFKVIRLIEL